MWYAEILNYSTCSQFPLPALLFLLLPTLPLSFTKYEILFVWPTSEKISLTPWSKGTDGRHQNAWIDHVERKVFRIYNSAFGMRVSRLRSLAQTLVHKALDDR